MLLFFEITKLFVNKSKTAKVKNNLMRLVCIIVHEIILIWDSFFCIFMLYMYTYHY